MSSAKDKYLESARKWIVKGQIDRAIKDYEQVVALDPVDMKHRQKLAELLVRMNRKDDAVKEYEAIGNYYADNSFYLKAIAVYKQIQKLTPAAVSITLKLAEFNRKQGLTGNALAEYTAAYSHFSRSGERKDCLQVLEKMLEIDPGNVNVLLKYAETRLAAGLKEDAYADFTRLAQSLLKKGDRQAYAATCDRIRKLFPEKGSFTLEMLAAQIEGGELAQAIPRLQEVIKADHRNLAAWKLLVKGYEKSGNIQELRSVYRYIIHFFPDEQFPREALIESAISQRDFALGRELVRTHLPWFLGKGLHAIAERMCQALHELQPGDEAVLSALRDVYQANGNEEKLREVLSRLNPAPAPPSPPPCAPEPPAPETSPRVETLAHEKPAPQETVQSVPEEDAWDEIDLSIVDCMAADASGAMAAAASEPNAIEPSFVPDDGDEDVVELSAILDEFGDAPVPVEDGPAPEAPAADRPFTLSDLMRQSGGEFGFPVGEGGFGVPAGAGPGSRDSFFSDEDLPTFSDFSTALDDLFGDALDTPGDAGSDHGAAAGAPHLEAGTVAEISATDSATHYDLGMAYRDMGLLDEAIKELRLAANDPHRAAGCLTLEAFCHRDKGDNASARASLKRVLVTEHATSEEMANASYELGIMSEMEGDTGEATRLFQDAQKFMPGFRDAAARAQGLRR